MSYIINLIFFFVVFIAALVIAWPVLLWLGTMLFTILAGFWLFGSHVLDEYSFVINVAFLLVIGILIGGTIIQSLPKILSTISSYCRSGIKSIFTPSTWTMKGIAAFLVWQFLAPLLIFLVSFQISSTVVSNTQLDQWISLPITMVMASVFLLSFAGFLLGFVLSAVSDTLAYFRRNRMASLPKE